MHNTLRRKIIAIDDNQMTISTFQRAVNRHKKPPLFDGVHTEKEAMDIIKNFRKSNVLPIFFVDLNIDDDDQSGFRILQGIRKKKALKNVPVVIISNSEDPESVTKSYNFGANAYHVKTGDGKLEKFVSDIMTYWMKNTDDPEVLHKKHSIK